MRKLVFVTVLTSIAGCSFADAPFSTDPAPVQSFHSVESTQSAQVAPAEQSSALTVQSVAKPVPPSAAPDVNAALIHPVLSQPVVAQNVDDTATRVQNLMQSNQAMGSAIRALNQNVAVLQQQVTQLEGAHASSSQAVDWFSQITQNPDFVGFLSFGAISVVLLMFGMMIGRKMVKKAQTVAVLAQKRVQADVLDDDTKSEYDFMSSSEAIPAKLDLARAYIAMNDEEQARLVLKTIVEKGNHEQRSEALALIQSMLNKK